MRARMARRARLDVARGGFRPGPIRQYGYGLESRGLMRRAEC
jgi:hypothetical protein